VARSRNRFFPIKTQQSILSVLLSYKCLPTA